MNQPPFYLTAKTLNRHGKPRQFAPYASGILVFVINEQEEFLLLRHPQRKSWEVVNGAMDWEETVLDAALRETAEEAGPIAVRPLGTVHTYTYRFDDAVSHMISIVYLMVYKGGDVKPGDDMAASEIGWKSVEQIESGEAPILVPNEQEWMFKRARDLYRLWKDEPDQELQLPFERYGKNKYGK